jgi:hypothetical protein
MPARSDETGPPRRIEFSQVPHASGLTDSDFAGPSFARPSPISLATVSQNSKRLRDRARLALCCSWRAGAVCVAHTPVPENITLQQLSQHCPRLRGRLGEYACTEAGSRRHDQRRACSLMLSWATAAQHSRLRVKEGQSEVVARDRARDRSTPRHKKAVGLGESEKGIRI